jgi:ferrous iron transport protein B
MFLVFQALFTGARPAMEALDAAIHWLGDRVAAGVPARAVRSLLVDGVFAGVGAVLAFLPQIVTLFFFIAVLEECGYMARAAYLMDKMLYRIGLSGKSFIPLLSSFACAIPGIMATRVIENRRDRLVTILVAPLMSCSARLPVYTLLIAAFVPDRRYLGGWVGLPGLTMVAMYCLGIVTAVAVALVLKRTILHGQAPTFVLELPTYHVPSLRTVLVRIFESGWSFVRYAGTLILAVTVLVWAGAYFPHPAALEQEVRAAARARGASAEEAAQDVAAAYLEQSVLGRAGQLFEPVVRPLGWDWRVGCAVIASFPSREVVISTLGVLYHLGDHQDAASEPLRQTLREARWPGTDRPIFTVPVALSLMVFYALCAQCAATLAVIRRETGSWQWAGFTFAYMTALAYGGAWLTYQIGTRFFS